MMKFILTHRVALVPTKKMPKFRAAALQLQIKWSEVARSEREVLIMMSDDDANRLKDHFDDSSSDGELPIPRLHDE